jgi:hypothetical protein
VGWLAPAVKFSDHYSILHPEADDWFDPILNLDTKLFVDPFLVFADQADERWRDAHDHIVGHFQVAFELLARGGCDPRSQHFTSTLRMLAFPEPSETCLGYTARGSRGSGSGAGFARLVASAMCDAIARGVVELRHFEELGILEEGIGPDRISDIATTILKPQLVAYTQSVASAHAVPLDRHGLRAGAFDTNRHGFMTATVQLPTNPATGGPVLLVPQRFLRDLPAINGDDWWNDMRAGELRDELNDYLAHLVRKRDIVALARRHPDKVSAWVAAREEVVIDPYDLARDPNGIYQWDSATKSYVRQNPTPLVNATTDDEFFAVIECICERFGHFIEQGGGWRLLWDGANEKPEEAVQLLFHGIAKSYCEANNIVVDREVELGRGPVDFKFSSGFERRALLEVKKLENGRFWKGLRVQLPTYMAADGCLDGWLLGVRFRDTGVAKDRARTLGREVALTSEALGTRLRYALVDARRRRSASKLDSFDGL